MHEEKKFPTEIIKDGESCQLKKALAHVSSTNSVNASITENSWSFLMPF